MAFISVFNVLGPEMTGPSSSHTAGACSIALLAQKIADSPITDVTFILYKRKANSLTVLSNSTVLFRSTPIL